MEDSPCIIRCGDGILYSEEPVQGSLVKCMESSREVPLKEGNPGIGLRIGKHGQLFHRFFSQFSNMGERHCIRMESKSHCSIPPGFVGNIGIESNEMGIIYELHTSGEQSFHQYHPHIGGTHAFSGRISAVDSQVYTHGTAYFLS
jgi:hypothetical protein